MEEDTQGQRTEPTPALSPPNSLPSAETFFGVLRRAFLVWSWIGLIGALTSSSAIFTNQLFLWTSEGVASYKMGYSQSLFATLMVLFPLSVLSIAWLTFYRYSVAIFEATILEINENAVVRHKLVWLFRRCVYYLAITWIAGVLASAAPVLAAFFLR